MKVQKLTLIRGVPGAGKSTLAKTLTDSNHSLKHFEADMFFMMDSLYTYDPTMIKSAHSWCQDATYDALNWGYDVVVSNTFVTLKELKPYFDIAKNFDIVPQVITLHANYGSIHAVPDESINRMKSRFVNDITELYTVKEFQ